jgi:hypothetical protein
MTALRPSAEEAVTQAKAGFQSGNANPGSRLTPG